MTPSYLSVPGTTDGLHDALVRLGRGRRGELGQVYDQSVTPALRLALARTRGDRRAAEALLVRAYAEVPRLAVEYPGSGVRALPWVLAVVARA